MRFIPVFTALLAASAEAHGKCGQKQKRLKRDFHHDMEKRQTKQSLNTTPYNLIDNAGGPTIRYNGTGDVPGYDQTSPVPSPITPITDESTLIQLFFNELQAINTGAHFKSTCNQCIASTEILHLAALTLSPESWTQLEIQYCELTNEFIYAVNCHAEFSPTPHNASEYSSDAGGEGPWYAQLYSKMSIATGDFDAWCAYNFAVCNTPPVIEIDESQYFSPKPASANTAPTPSGETFNVLHISDWHIDPRYDIGSEANCSQYLCCRPYATNDDLNTGASNPSVPASRFGYLYCDSPADLAISAFTEMNKFIDPKDISFTIFTGDIISHDNDDQLSRAYVEYNERQTYETFHAHMPHAPVYATLGNHDNLPEAFTTPNNLIDSTNNTANAMSWDYDLLSSLWLSYNWITSDEEEYASTHYGGYAHTTKQGLRVISINTDFWYVDNIFNYYNFSNPDTSGTLAWLASELEQCEQKGQRAWIIGHVPSGYDGSNGLPNPTALFYSIVTRFSPATIAGVFFGHDHEDQIQIFYDYAASSIGKSGLRNTTDVDYTKPLTVGYIGPSITPLTGNNAGYQILQVDSKTFDVMGVQTYFANVSDSLSWTTPQWEFEYDTRKTFGAAIKWPKTQALGAAFWDSITSAMEKNSSLIQAYNLLETKSSVVTGDCTGECLTAKVCYIRSGSAALGQACPQGSFPF